MSKQQIGQIDRIGQIPRGLFRLEDYRNMGGARWEAIKQGIRLEQARQRAPQDCDNIGCPRRGTMRCGRCGESRYCSAGCQRQDWRMRHRAECQMCAYGKHRCENCTRVTDGDFCMPCTEPACNLAGDNTADHCICAHPRLIREPASR